MAETKNDINIYRFPTSLEAGDLENINEDSSSNSPDSDGKKKKEKLKAPFILIEILDELNKTATDVIAMFAPSGFTIEDSGNYGSVNFGVADSISNLGRDVIQDAGAKTKGQIGKMSVAESSLITQAVLKAAGADNELMSVATSKQKIVFNNKTTATFEDMTIRTFSFTFKMVPVNNPDSEAILKIEETLRANMYPEASASGYALKYPPEFRVTFKRGKEDDKFMPKLMKCYLTSMSTQYNSNGNMFHSDGAPTDTTITLNFQETRQLRRGDFKKKTPEAAKEGAV